MKRAVFLFLLLPLIASSQPNLMLLQQEWVENVQSGDPVSDFRWEGKSLIYADMETGDPVTFKSLVKNDEMSSFNRYEHGQGFKHDKFRYITIGDIITDNGKLFLLSGWRKVEGQWKKEIDVLLSQTSGNEEVSDGTDTTLNTERKQWVRLANSRDSQAHIAYSYTPDAIYFSNGRRSDGTQEIARGYSYIENPNYRVNLEKKYLRQVSGQQILEVGRYYAGKRKGNPGGLYVILWERQENNSWKIALDFNF